MSNLQSLHQRCERPIILESFGKGIRAMTLRYPYEVRDEKVYFEDIEDVKIEKENLQLAKQIVERKADDFDPQEFVDHYEVALVEMLKKKQAGQPVKRGAAPRPASPKVIDLMEVLRRSVSETKRPAKKPLPLQAAQPKGKAKARQRA